MRPINAMFGKWFHFLNDFDDATDEASSTHYEKVYPTLWNSKFGFFGPSIPLFTQNEIKIHM